MLSKITQFVKNNKADIILFIGAVLISLFSFAAGYITAKQSEKKPIQFKEHKTMNNEQHCLLSIDL